MLTATKTNTQSQQYFSVDATYTTDFGKQCSKVFNINWPKPEFVHIWDTYNSKDLAVYIANRIKKQINKNCCVITSAQIINLQNNCSYNALTQVSLSSAQMLEQFVCSQ